MDLFQWSYSVTLFSKMLQEEKNQRHAFYKRCSLMIVSWLYSWGGSYAPTNMIPTDSVQFNSLAPLGALPCSSGKCFHSIWWWHSHPAVISVADMWRYFDAWEGRTSRQCQSFLAGVEAFQFQLIIAEAVIQRAFLYTTSAWVSLFFFFLSVGGSVQGTYSACTVGKN